LKSAGDPSTQPQTIRLHPEPRGPVRPASQPSPPTFLSPFFFHLPAGPTRQQGAIHLSPPCDRALSPHRTGAGGAPSCPASRPSRWMRAAWLWARMPKITAVYSTRPTLVRLYKLPSRPLLWPCPPPPPGDFSPNFSPTAAAEEEEGETWGMRSCGRMAACALEGVCPPPGRRGRAGAAGAASCSAPCPADGKGAPSLLLRPLPPQVTTRKLDRSSTPTPGP
jgi:hypothetical protein